jgi:hypothetical protein
MKLVKLLDVSAMLKINKAVHVCWLEPHSLGKDNLNIVIIRLSNSTCSRVCLASTNSFFNITNFGYSITHICTAHVLTEIMVQFYLGSGI